MPLRSLAVLVVLASCADPELAATQAAIVGGDPAPDDHAVVAIVRRSVGCQPSVATVECTGTVIAPRVVITAAHCVGGGPPSALEIVLGPDVVTSTMRIGVAGGRVHPAFDPVTHANDLAVLLLDADAAVTPIVAHSTDLPDLTGTDVRLVGYGITSGASADVGARRAGVARISETGADELRMVPGPGMSCRGDSGGPVLGAGGELIGVTSYGDPTCTQLGVAIRVDRHAAFIREIVDLASASPVRRAFDPDEAFCDRTCATDADCPAETMCFGLPEQLPRCVYRGLPAGELGAACTSDGDCACVAMPDGSCREFLPCIVEDGATCRAADAGCGCGSARGGSPLLVVGLGLWLACRIRGSGDRARRSRRTAPR